VLLLVVAGVVLAVAGVVLGVAGRKCNFLVAGHSLLEDSAAADDNFVVAEVGRDLVENFVAVGNSMGHNFD